MYKNGSGKFDMLLNQTQPNQTKPNAPSLSLPLSLSLYIYI